MNHVNHTSRFKPDTKKFAASLFIVLAATIVAPNAISSAHASEEIAKQNGCFGCHAIDDKVLGPSFKEVAKKYAGQEGAVTKITESIRKGSTGTWGNIPMPAHDHINAETAKSIATWVMATKTQKTQ
jgi:cytochrome c